MFAKLSKFWIAAAALGLAAAGAYQQGLLQKAGSLIGLGPDRIAQVPQPGSRTASIVVHRGPDDSAPDSLSSAGRPAIAVHAVGGIRIPTTATMARKTGPAIATVSPLEAAAAVSPGSEPSAPVAAGSNAFSQSFGSMGINGVSLGASPSVQPIGVRSQGNVVSISNRR